MLSFTSTRTGFMKTSKESGTQESSNCGVGVRPQNCKATTKLLNNGF
jgi:hypothetical protein